MPKIFNDLDSAKAFFADIPESESKPRTDLCRAEHMQSIQGFEESACKALKEARD